ALERGKSMSEYLSSLTTVATFSIPEEARLARNRLKAEGIAAFLQGEGAVGLWNLGNAFGAVKLAVAAEDLERARNLLSQVRNSRLAGHTQPGTEQLDADQADAWTCPGCRLQVGYEYGTCPRCGTSVDLLDDPVFTPGGSEAKTSARETQGWWPISEAD